MALVSGVSKVEIVSLAFGEIGSPEPMIDLNSTPATSQASKRYDVIKLNILSAHPWRFAMRSSALAKLVEKPTPREWQYAYALPDNFLTAYRLRPQLRFEQFQDKIYINYNNVGGSDLILDYISNVNEQSFPGYFVELMIKMLASYLSMAVAQNVTLKQSLLAESRMQLGVARTIDSKSTPNAQFTRDALIEAHLGNQ